MGDFIKFLKFWSNPVRKYTHCFWNLYILSGKVIIFLGSFWCILIWVEVVLCSKCCREARWLEMGESRKPGLGILMVVIMCSLYQNLGLCWSLNDEGLALLRFRERVVSDPFRALANWDDGELDPCSWFGVECSDGKVVILNLKDLCLRGTLAPELGSLANIKSIILRNNSFSGTIPEEIGELKELEVLDLGYNNLCVPIPANLGNNLSLTILLLDNNVLISSLPSQIHELVVLSESQVDENRLSNIAKISSLHGGSCTRKTDQTEDVVHHRLLSTAEDRRTRSTTTPVPTPSPNSSDPSVSSSGPSLTNTSSSSPSESSSGKSNLKHTLLLVGVIGGSVLVFICIICIYLFRTNKVATVKPWATGLSGQLQKVFVTGVPKLKRSELETACEDFSNVIGSSSIGTVYKGTLSSGVEIAVTSAAVTSSKDWSKNLEVQFRKKIERLSKVNHKNFVNLLGYCEEEEPFTRMMVFEYAPNGTLFEHLHIKEAEHLDWAMRLRAAMGMAYYLNHIHQLTPPIAHENLNSSAVNLAEDYAAKVSDFSVWNLSASPSADPESNVYSFGVILFEMITGRVPYSVDNGSLEDWASNYLQGDRPIKEMVDPTLKFFQEEQLESIREVIKSCVNPDPKQRPTMRDVTARMREITEIGPDGAIPKLSPLWWAELEILSTEAS
ncbi:unnamed protein product, partial [Vitis vinifera]